YVHVSVMPHARLTKTLRDCARPLRNCPRTIARVRARRFATGVRCKSAIRVEDQQGRTMTERATKLDGAAARSMTCLALVLCAMPASAQVSPRERLDPDCIDRANGSNGRHIGGAVLLRPSVGGVISGFDDAKIGPPTGL